MAFTNAQRSAPSRWLHSIVLLFPLFSRISNPTSWNFARAAFFTRQWRKKKWQKGNVFRWIADPICSGQIEWKIKTICMCYIYLSRLIHTRYHVVSLLDRFGVRSRNCYNNKGRSDRRRNGVYTTSETSKIESQQL